MSRVLSQDEVKALLQQPVPVAAPEPEDVPSKVEPYDFRERDRLPRSRLRYLQFLHDRFVQYLGVSLSAYLRNALELRLEKIGQLSSSRLLHDLPDPCAMFVAEASACGNLLVVVDNGLALAVVDRLLGGGGGKPKLERPLTEIELSVLGGLTEIILGALGQAWAPMVDVNFKMARTETRPALVHLDPPDENQLVLQIPASLGAGESATTGLIRISFSMTVADRLSTAMAEEKDSQPVAREDADVSAMEALLRRAPVAITVELGARGVTAGDLVRLQPGLVLSLGRAVEEPAVVRVGGIANFQGTLALSRGNPALAVTALCESE